MCSRSSREEETCTRARRGVDPDASYSSSNQTAGQRRRRRSRKKEARGRGRGRRRGDAGWWQSQTGRRWSRRSRGKQSCNSPLAERNQWLVAELFEVQTRGVNPLGGIHLSFGVTCMLMHSWGMLSQNGNFFSPSFLIFHIFLIPFDLNNERYKDTVDMACFFQFFYYNYCILKS